MELLAVGSAWVRRQALENRLLLAGNKYDRCHSALAIQMDSEGKWGDCCDTLRLALNGGEGIQKCEILE